MTTWSELHAQARYRPRWPSEHVVRWLVRLPGKGLALDIGAGAGRHTKLLSEFGYTAVATDISLEGLRHIPLPSTVEIFRSDRRVHRRPVQATATALPFPDGSFDVALAYASAYYSPSYWDAIREMARILKPGGHGFVSLRTTDDHVPSRGDDLMMYWTVPETALAFTFRHFSDMKYERADITRSDRTELDSEWLISVTR